MEGELAISDIIPTNYCIRFGHAYPRTSYQRERLNYQIIKQFCKVLKCDLFPPIRYVAKFSVTLFVSVRVIVHWQHSRLNYSFKGKAMMKQHQETFKERILKLKIAIYIKKDSTESQLTVCSTQRSFCTESARCGKMREKFHPSGWTGSTRLARVD